MPTFGKHDKAITFLNFENGTDLGADASGYARNGVATAVNQVVSLGGKSNVASFDINNDSGISLTALLPSFSASTSLSFSGWIRLNSIASTPSPGVRCIFSVSDNTQASREWIVFAETNDLKFQIRSPTVLFQIVATDVFVIDTWYHVACSSGPSGANLWLNGVSVGTNVSTASVASITTNRAQIGYNVDNASGGLGREFEFDGYMKDLFISTAELNNSTVADIYNNDLYGYECLPLIGQSNQIGRPSIVGGIDDDYTVVSGKVFQWGYNANARATATNPLDHVNESAGDMGHWLAMCNALVPELAYKQGVMLVPAAQGGTGFATNNWNPGDVLYEAALARINSAMAYHTYSNMRMVHWFQGETDADNGNTTYETDLQAMYDDLDGRATGFNNTVPFVAAEIKGSTIPANVAVINAALASFVAAGSERYLVETGDLTLFDQFHFDTTSLRIVGARSAAVLVAVEPPDPPDPSGDDRSLVQTLVSSLTELLIQQL